MDKKLILAVAGSGKTSELVRKLNLEERFLLITYTQTNLRNLEISVAERFGYIPSNIKLFTYYTFLYSFCFRPFLGYRLRPRGIYWKNPPPKSYRKKNDPLRYMTKNGLLYYNRIAKLIEVCKVSADVNDRLVKYYDHLFVDEVQDFAGHDFNLLCTILSADINILLVGDFYQHTFDTSRDGNTNSGLHKKLDTYRKRFEEREILVDNEGLIRSHRCSRSVCEFISTQLGIQIESHKEEEGLVQFVEDREEIDRIFFDESIVKLFFKKSSDYMCYSSNWGGSKGENHYNDVCVVLNRTTLNHFNKGELHNLSPTTKNKLYVACSRANGNLFLIPEESIKKYKR